MAMGRVLSHYELIEKVGEGGMGEVRRARDTQLERDVDAVRAARYAVALIPIETDVHLGAMRRADLAATLVAVGRLDEAIHEIEYPLSVPPLITPEILEIEPRWRDVRDHPRLHEVVAAYRGMP
ncbi:MAG: hypothetical protein ACYTG2_13275 [Planctomycetota bacterium]|jgi:serine/threonine protein kinase